MRQYHDKNGQSTLEFVVLFVVVIAALVAMQVYLKRGIQGRLRESSDQLGQQFSPGRTTSNIKTDTFSNFLEENNTGGAANGETKVTYNNQWQDQSGTETVMAMNQEFWAPINRE